MKIFYLIFFLILAVYPCQAATYNWYFSDDATGNAQGDDANYNSGDMANSCTQVAPCKTLATFETAINDANTNDVVYAYFDRTDGWWYDTTTLEGPAAYIEIYNNDPTVHIDAYGSGAKPIFNGGVTDFSTTDSSACTGAPCYYSRFFLFAKQNCSISNVQIKNVYGNAIFLGYTTYSGDGFTLSNSDVFDIGWSSIAVRNQLGAEDVTIEYNSIYRNQLLKHHSKVAVGQAGAISLTASNHGSASMCKNNTVRYNRVYDSGGECINAPNSTIEYNVVGDCMSIAINTSAHDFDYLSPIVRYNLVVGTGTATYGRSTGIRIYDEAVGGDNSAADVKVYGNIVINKTHGIRAYCSAECANPFASVKIYNNTVIDCSTYNFSLWNPSEWDDIDFHNNTSILYDRSGTKHTAPLTPDAGWSIENNSFWTDGGSPSYDADYNTNAVETDPDLPGEPSLDWDGLANIDSVDFDTHLYPPGTSPLVGAGKTLDSNYVDSFLTTGTDFENVLNGGSAFSQQVQSAPWDIGAMIRSGGGDVTAPVLNTATVETDGLTLTLVFTEAGSDVQQGSGYNDSDWDLDCTDRSDLAIVYSSGNGTNTHVYTVSQGVYSTDVCDIDFNGDIDSLEDDAGNDLALITSQVVTNESDMGKGTISYHGMGGAGIGF